jgi:hypothetical protein
MPNCRHIAVAALSIMLLSGFSLFDSLLAPKAELWPKWQTHDATNKRTLDHRVWDEFLKSHVTVGEDGIHRVAYAKAATESKAALYAYLDSLRQAQVHKLNRAEQMAFWINLYNALTVRVVLDFHPVQSIRDINLGGSLFGSGPWDKKLIRIEGEMLSLNDIEHRILRPIWNEPRLHYVLNCAALGCPNLARRAYRAASMEQMLIRAAKAFVNHPRGLTINDGELTLSKIYSWYADDFGGEQGVLTHLSAYANSDTDTKLMLSNGVSGYEYDWRINRSD